jgi:hypothetical protein
MAWIYDFSSLRRGCIFFFAFLGGRRWSGGKGRIVAGDIGEGQKGGDW